MRQKKDNTAQTMDYSQPFLGKIVTVKMDRPLGSKHPKHGHEYPVNYGFVPNTKAPDGGEIDAYVLGIDQPLKEFTGKCIAIIHRTNDDDDKLVVVPEGQAFTDEQIRELTHFQEQWFESEIVRAKVSDEAMTNAHMLKVFTDADGNFGDRASVIIDEGRKIPDSKRQELAKQLNTGETVFVNDLANANISIVHPQGEIAFAGVAALATAWLIGKLRGTPATLLHGRDGDIKVWQDDDLTWVRADLKTMPPWNYKQFDSPKEVEQLTLEETKTWQHTMAWAWINEAQGLIRARTFASDWDIPEAQGNGSGSMLLAAKLKRNIEIKHGEGSVIFAKPVGNSEAALGGRVVTKANQDLFAELDKLFLPTLRHVRHAGHPKLMVVFSGPPGSGKSRVAQAIENHFRGLRLENDAIRTLVAQHYPELGFEERNELVYHYGVHMGNYLAKHAPNGLWIIDSSIDRRHNFFYDFAKQHGFATLLIAMDIPEDIHRSWITQGGDRPFSSLANYLRLMPQRRQEQAEFLAAHKPDLILRPGYDMAMVFKAVEEALHKTAN